MKRLVVFVWLVIFLFACFSILPDRVVLGAGVVKFGMHGIPEEGDIIDMTFKAFMKKYPDIKIQIEKFEPWNIQQLLTRLSGGTAPDLWWSGGTHAAYLGARGLLEPLESYVKDDPSFELGDIYPVALEIATYKGHLYQLPIDAGAYPLYYNEDLFKKSGLAFPKDTWTLNDLLLNARKLTKGEGAGKQFGVYIDSLQIFSHIVGNNGRIMDETGTKLLMDSPQALNAIQWFADLANKHKVMPSVDIQRTTPVNVMFETGRLAMAQVHCWNGYGFQKAKGLRYNVAFPPLMRNGKRITNYHSPGGPMVNKNAQNKEDAIRLAKFLAGPEGQKLMFGMGMSTVSYRKSINESEELVRRSVCNPNNPNERWEVYSILQKEALPLPQWPKPIYFEVDNMVWQALNAVLSGAKTAKEAIPPMVKSVNELIAKELPKYK
ncbi:MAG: sugar ABC transporter substrate-binding protein [Nitrososphaeria archaeon]